MSNEHPTRTTASSSSSGPLPSVSFDLPGMLRRRWWVMVGCVVASFVAGLVMLQRMPAVYRTEAKVQLGAMEQQAIGDTLSGPGAVDLEAEAQLMRSTALMNLLAEHPALAETTIAKSGSSEGLAGRLKSAIYAEPAGSGNTMAIWMDSRYPEDGPVVLTALVDSFLEFQNRSYRTTAGVASRALLEEKQRMEEELAAKQQDMIRLKRSQGSLTFGLDGSNVEVQRLQRLEKELSAAQTRLRSLSALHDQLTTSVQSPKAVWNLVHSMPEFGRLTGVISEQDKASILAADRLELEIAEYTRRYGEQHPAVRSRRNRLVTLAEVRDRVLRRVADEIRTSTARGVQRAQGELASAQDRYDLQHEHVMSLNTSAANYEFVDAEARRLETRIDDLDSRIKRLALAERAPSLDVTVLEPPRGAYQIAPSGSKVMSMAVLLGLMLGGAAAFAQEWLDERVRQRDDLVRAIGAGFIGAVPKISKLVEGLGPGRLLTHAPRSQAAESYRAIRTAMHFQNQVRPFGTLLITSPMTGDGKTTLASNLAAAFAQAGRRTLLIDGDLRRPTLATIYGHENDQGLREALSGEAAFEDAVRPTDLPMLDLMTSGRPPDHPMELIGGPATDELLEKARSLYEHVIIDSPPICTVADASLFAGLCDRTLLVARSGWTRRSMAVEAKRLLSSVGADVAGVVLNAVTEKPQRYYDAYYYGSIAPADADRAEKAKPEASVHLT